MKKCVQCRSNIEESIPFIVCCGGKGLWKGMLYLVCKIEWFLCVYGINTEGDVSKFSKISIAAKRQVISGEFWNFMSRYLSQIPHRNQVFFVTTWNILQWKLQRAFQIWLKHNWSLSIAFSQKILSLYSIMSKSMQDVLIFIIVSHSILWIPMQFSFISISFFSSSSMSIEI